MPWAKGENSFYRKIVVIGYWLNRNWIPAHSACAQGRHCVGMTIVEIHFTNDSSFVVVLLPYIHKPWKSMFSYFCSFCLPNSRDFPFYTNHPGMFFWFVDYLIDSCRCLRAQSRQRWKRNFYEQPPKLPMRFALPVGFCVACIAIVSVFGLRRSKVTKPALWRP